MSTNNIEMKTIQKLPSLMGEVDVIKSIQMLPGVQNGGEGTTGFFVRGGSADQNLILLDEAAVYNASHLGGFLSVFNSDVVKSVKLYKGGIPAGYGGRLSSLLDIRMKEGNINEFKGRGGIGILSSRLTLEAPIIKERSSFIVAGRRTYADLFFPLSSNEMAKNSTAYFYDLNMKANYRFNEKNRIYVSGYFGRDIVGFSDMMGMEYGNGTFTLRYNHLFSDRIFSNTTLIYCDFDYGMEISEGPIDFKWKSGITTKQLKHDYTYYLNPQNTVKFGISAIHHTFEPGNISSNDTMSIISSVKLPQVQALEYGVFVSNEQKFTEHLSAHYGLRFSAFQNVNASKFYKYDRSNPEEYIPVDTMKYDNGEFYSTYTEFEPRLGIRLQLNKQTSIKASYNRTVQYIHLASNTNSPTPLDIWFPCSPNIKPQKADQVALGLFRNFKNNMFETSLEVYYKKMQNSIDFRDHANLMMNKYQEGEMRIGEAYSYGAELMVKKQMGSLTGWLGYTWSKTRMKIDDVNQGKEYPTTYDKPHDVSVILSYDITDRINVSTTWVYSTGAPRTMPTGRGEYGNMVFPVFSNRNGERLPDYHRMDLSCTIDGREKRRDGTPRKFNSSWNFSIYNLYNRHNAYSINFRQHPEKPHVTQAEKLYLFKIFPSITYNFSF